MKHDPRLTPAREDIAATHLRGTVTAGKYVDGVAYCVKVPVLDLVARPDARSLETQLRFGEGFTVYDVQDGLAWGQAAADGYVGYVRRDGLGDRVMVTHRVHTLFTNVYPEATVKSRPIAALPYRAALAVTGIRHDFAELATGGFVPAQHVIPEDAVAADPVAVAGMFLGCPYLWGGTTALGLDCSALVQLSLQACGVACPRDSDMQEAALGRALDDGEPLQHGDLVFWKSHVGMMSGTGRLLHISAHYMTIRAEPLAEAMVRIQITDGPVTSRRRVSLSPAG